MAGAANQGLGPTRRMGPSASEDVRELGSMPSTVTQAFRARMMCVCVCVRLSVTLCVCDRVSMCLCVCVCDRVSVCA